MPCAQSTVGAVQDGCAGCVWHGGVRGLWVAVVALVQGQSQAVSPSGLLLSPGVVCTGINSGFQWGFE